MPADDELIFERPISMDGNGYDCSTFEVETYKKMCAALLYSVWAPSGLEILRPNTPARVLLTWMYFSRFGSLHWRKGAGKACASPSVDGNDVATEVADWARSAYEQLGLLWVHMCVGAAESNCFQIFSSDSRWMVCKDFHVDFKLPPSFWDNIVGYLGDVAIKNQDWSLFSSNNILKTLIE